MKISADYLIFGAGIYGLYAAKYLAERGRKVVVVEVDDGAFQRASFVNQARVHNGYHYPRSISTAKKSASYYERFNRDFSFAINKRFRKIYAIAAKNSFTSGEQFKKFCDYVQIPAREVWPDHLFKQESVEAAFETEEFSYDAEEIRAWFLEKLLEKENVSILFAVRAKGVEVVGDRYRVLLTDDIVVEATSVVNATYAGTNQVSELFGLDKFKIKYEMAEVILVKPNSELKPLGITVMDGPFFSVMPFGLSGLHSLTSVTFTPHRTSYGELPEFPCQRQESECTPSNLRNCNSCSHQPTSAYPYMRKLSEKYLQTTLDFNFNKSLFAIKAIMMKSELDDSRPTVIRKLSESPNFISVLSGKFNTMYDLEGVLE